MGTYNVYPLLFFILGDHEDFLLWLTSKLIHYEPFSFPAILSNVTIALCENLSMKYLKLLLFPAWILAGEKHINLSLASTIFIDAKSESWQR